MSQREFKSGLRLMNFLEGVCEYLAARMVEAFEKRDDFTKHSVARLFGGFAGGGCYGGEPKDDLIIFACGGGTHHVEHFGDIVWVT